MSQYIIDELNNTKESASNILLEIHAELSQITSYTKYCYNLYDSDLYEVFQFESLVNKEWGMDIISHHSFELLVDYFSAWKQYRVDNLYGDDEVFVYSDINWHNLVKKLLIPLLISIEQDFDRNNIQYKSYTESYNPDSRPSDEDILERGRILYKLLLDGRLIHRKYL